MLHRMNSKLHEPELQELLSYSVFPDPERLEAAIELYRTSDELHLYGYESECEIVGIIGIQMLEGGRLMIRHLAVKPEYRGAGFGRGLILEAIALLNPQTIVAETDDEAVDFYRNIGFEIESLGEQSPGYERFKCSYAV